MTESSPKAASDPLPGSEAINIDSLLSSGLALIQAVLVSIKKSLIKGGPPDRETVQNLKDVMSMLHDLKKKEQELLDTLSDEDLEKLARK